MDWLALAIEYRDAVRPSTLEPLPKRSRMAMERTPGELQEGHEVNDNIRDSCVHERHGLTRAD
jgi:hypothetical protein